MFKNSNRSGLPWLWLSAIVMSLDQTTKILAQQHLLVYDSLSVTPFFNLTLSYNTGAAFSFLAKGSGWQLWFLSFLALTVCGVLIGYLKNVSNQKRSLCMALALIIGGALGNCWDRLLDGHVIDFLDVHVLDYHWPTFNLADSCICIGATLLMLLSCKGNKTVDRIIT
jgi:signal peptidase II